jgi:uracil-DNA glycosylase
MVNGIAGSHHLGMNDSLIAALRRFHGPNVFNPWSDSDPMDVGPGAKQRCHRLRQHLECRADFLLVGEASGYQGCHFSGVPFTNESLLLADRIPRIGARGRISKRLRPWCEPSATVVWGRLHELGIAHRTVLWNAFAWHPHRPGEPMSNRPPTRDELKLAAPVLQAILNLFADARAVAVGRVAEAALSAAGVSAFAPVRHPAMGGANLFREQLGALVRLRKR